jgi:hypothetical protein
VKIACSDCEMYQSHHCEDCLVTALLHPQQDSVEIDEDLESPLGTLTEGGLIPVLRFRPRPAEGPTGDLSDTG